MTLWDWKENFDAAIKYQLLHPQQKIFILYTTFFLKKNSGKQGDDSFFFARVCVQLNISDVVYIVQVNITL